MIFVHNDQSTATVPIAYVPRGGGGTDMNISLNFYFDCVFTCGSEEVVESFKAIVQRRKTT